MTGSQDSPAAPPGIVNIANILTVVRIFLVPFFVVCLIQGGTAWRIGALVAFIGASATDFLDGQLARKRGLVTDFGKIADPIADKALTGAALVTLTALGELSGWVTGLILARELGITVLRFAVIRRGVIAASQGGKLKTMLQILAICLYVLPASLGLPAIVKEVAMGTALVVTLVTGADYVVRAMRMKRPPPDEELHGGPAAPPAASPRPAPRGPVQLPTSHHFWLIISTSHRLALDISVESDRKVVGADGKWIARSDRLALWATGRAPGG